jgi:hypothetical protein
MAPECRYVSRECPSRVDTVEKVGGVPLTRNNRIMGDGFLIRSCAFGGRLESMLLGDPPQNPFSTVSVTPGKAQTEHNESALPRLADEQRTCRATNRHSPALPFSPYRV